MNPHCKIYLSVCLGLIFSRCTPKLTFQGEPYSYVEAIYKKNRVREVIAFDSVGQRESSLFYDELGYLNWGTEITKWEFILKKDTVSRYGRDDSTISYKEQFVFNNRGFLISAFKAVHPDYTGIDRGEYDFTDISYDSLGRLLKVETVCTHVSRQNYSESINLKIEDIPSLGPRTFYTKEYFYDPKKRLVVFKENFNVVGSFYYRRNGRKYREIYASSGGGALLPFRTEYIYKRRKTIFRWMRTERDLSGLPIVKNTIVETVLYRNQLPKAEYEIKNHVRKLVHTFTYKFY